MRGTGALPRDIRVCPGQRNHLRREQAGTSMQPGVGGNCGGSPPWPRSHGTHDDDPSRGVSSMIDQWTATEEPAPGKRHTVPTGSQPHLPHWVIFRPRLNERLHTGVQRPLTVITGPPGAGKTITALAWAATAARAPKPIICWVTCDGSTVTVQGFCGSLIKSLSRTGIDVAAIARARHDIDAREQAMVTAITAA